MRLVNIGRVVLLAPGFLVSSVCACIAAGAAELPPLDEPGRIKNVTSSDGHFVAVGFDPIRSLDVIKWARGTAEQLNRALGFEIPLEGRVIRILNGAALRKSGEESSLEDAVALLLKQMGDNPDSDADAGIGGVRVETRDSGLLLMQFLEIPDYELIEQEKKDEALCRLLMEGHVSRLVRGGSRKSAVPEWLITGFARNLQQETKTRDIAGILDSWNKGELPSPLNLMAGRVARADQLFAPLSGGFVQWLRAAQEGGACIREAFESIARGETLTPAWMAGRLPECASADDIDRHWDDWVVGQRWVVREPGSADRQILEQLQAELLLYPGDCGIPSRVEGPPTVSWRDLIRRKQEAWIPAFCAGKTARLRLLTVGRGGEIVKVVDAYARFLDALAKRKKARTVIPLLREAEATYLMFQRKVML